MTEKHPYTSSSVGIVSLVNQLRKSFPSSPITAETLKKLSIAPNNETYVLNIFRFIGVLDSENKKIPEAGAVFNKHDPNEFQQGFAALVQNAYHEIFDLHGPDAWHLDLDRLISFFRNHDETSDIVGRRQATTFQTLAKISGKAPEEGLSNIPAKKTARVRRATAKKSSQMNTEASSATGSQEESDQSDKLIPPPGVALTVRIEINLPSGGDKSTYDAIFKSIRENLMNGKGT